MAGRDAVLIATRAHLFQIDPQTKKNWRPLSTEAAPLVIVGDGGTEFRIIAGDPARPTYTSTLLPTSLFTKTSPKFGQWTDVKAATVFGLGFANEAELVKVHAEISL
jgi:homer protein